MGPDKYPNLLAIATGHELVLIIPHHKNTPVIIYANQYLY